MIKRFLIPLLLAAAPAAAATHCAPAEQVVFSCPAGRKIVSVCLAEGALKYRFGRAGQPEIALSGLKVKAGTWTFSGGGGAWPGVRRDPYRYVVYTAIGRGWGEKAGLAVERGRRRLTNLPCRSTPASQLGPDFFAAAGITGDDRPFDLP